VERAGTLAAAGKTPMYVAVDGQVAGVIAVADTVKPSARVLIPQLKQAGIDVAMMSGDNRRTAEAVAHELGIERVFAEVLPEQKAEYVRRLQEKIANSSERQAIDVASLALALTISPLYV
jgi:P-type E1-E2 ATPase